MELIISRCLDAPFIWPTTSKSPGGPLLFLTWLILYPEVFVDAIEEVGISISPDQANGNAIGGFYTPHNQDPETATRSSAREAYYDTVATRSNLHLITGQQVTRILSNGTGDSVCVTGVEVRRSMGNYQTVPCLQNYASLHLVATLQDRPSLSKRRPFWQQVPFSHRRFSKSQASETRRTCLASTLARSSTCQLLARTSTITSS